MAVGLQVAGPGAIVTLVFLSIIITIRLSRFSILQYGRKKYRNPHERLNFQREISVILTIHDPNDPNMLTYVRSILKNKPEQLFITTSDTKAQHRVDGKLNGLRAAYSATQISVGAVNEPNRRREIAHALSSINTPLTVLTDQGVHWPEGFLKSALIPFADRRVGCVTVPMIARKPDGIWDSFLACLFSCYYGLMAEENRAFNALDCSAIFPGSPILFRTYLAAQLRFKQQFEVEPCLNRRHGVHKADEYLFFNRYFLQEEAVHGAPCLVVFQDTPEATVQVDRRSIGEFLRECLQMTRNLWRLSRAMIRRKERKTYPYAFYLTHLSSFVSFTMIYEIMIVFLVHFTILFDDEWIAWVTLGYLLYILQAFVAGQIMKRFRTGGYGYGRWTLLMAIMVGIPAHYVLEVLKLVALATAWKADVELISEADIKVRVGDPGALWYHVGGVEEARTENNEPPWISGCMEMTRPQRALQPLPDFPMFVIDE
ncbi:uncharacterized protein BKA55DRAFT_536165 [Fusarium redolens]|jgi:hypothetical protein|uniref:Ceramide glucosyltransferase n=1 Tax=Fusarium redolens TaxID=48865 RepID=A0A9P9HPW2_FUSRE|nr:uncharacterized protein BKA55DRAFT_536165 [Fusarium redolens]KAH7261156.1 hypothetical protein BKA55DRAFT_536165 [Fusarium redolens]